MLSTGISVTLLTPSSRSIPQIVYCKIFNHTVNTSYFRLFTSCLVLAVKFYEEAGFIKNDKTYERVIQISIPLLVDFQLEILTTIGFNIFISEETFVAYRDQFLSLAKLQ